MPRSVRPLLRSMTPRVIAGQRSRRHESRHASGAARQDFGTGDPVILPSPERARACRGGKPRRRGSQRGWNTHPEGGSRGLGTSPGRTRCSRPPRPSSSAGSGIGTASSKALAYGCIGVSKRASQSASSTSFPRYIHRHPLAQVPNHAEIVADEQIGESELGLEVLEQVDDLRLNRDVQRRDRFVAHDELRVEGDGPRNSHPLALTAAHLVRIALGDAAGQAADVEKLEDLAIQIPLLDVLRMEVERLAYGLAYGHAGVQRRVGILEDRPDLSAVTLGRAGIEGREVLPVEEDRPLGGLQQLEDAPGDGRLPASGLADEAERLPAANGEAHLVDGLHVADGALEDEPSGDGKVLAQIPHLQEQRRSGPEP